MTICGACRDLPMLLWALIGSGRRGVLRVVCVPCDRAVAAIAKAHSKSVAQVALKWILQSQVAELTVVTKASTAAYIKEDVSLFGWELTPAEMTTLNQLTAPSNVPSWGCTK